MPRSLEATAAGESASILPCTILPALSRTEYWYVSVAAMVVCLLYLANSRLKSSTWWHFSRPCS